MVSGCRRRFWLQRINLNLLQILQRVLMQGCVVQKLVQPTTGHSKEIFFLPGYVGIHSNTLSQIVTLYFLFSFLQEDLLILHI